MPQTKTAYLSLSFQSMKKMALLIGFSIIACNNHKKPLPILGERTIVKRVIAGKLKPDTLYHHIPAFDFLDQHGQHVTEQTVKNKIYVADFFFTSCPSICPIMKRNLLKVYDRFHARNDFMILSHTIDPQHDSVSILHRFAEKLHAHSRTWRFLWGETGIVHHLAQTAYMAVVHQDQQAPGGFVHSGYFLLVDGNRHIRGAYDGTNDEQVAQLMEDIGRLYEERKCQ